MGERKDAVQPPSPVYTAADFFLVRAPVLPTHIFAQIAATSTDSNMHRDEELDGTLARTRQRCQDLLRALAAQPVVEQALASASTAIFEGLARIQRGETSQRTERTYSRLLRYLLRMCTRPTPFGLFAGVAMGIFAESTTMQLATSSIRRMRTRPDMGWMLSIIQNVEQTKELLPHLHVVVNQSAYLTGERVVLPYADVYGQGDNRSISLRATPVVRSVLECARSPIPYQKVRAHLLGRFAHATSDQVERLLQQLWENHFLTSNLRPPLTSADPAHYMLDRLCALPGAEAVSEPLKEVLELAARIDRAGVGGPVDLLRELTHRQDQLVPEHKDLPFQVDASLHLQAPQLNARIGEAAEQAGELLLRLSRVPRGMTHLHEYRLAFLERYGSESEVPLLDLLSPEAGLDAPPTYVQPPRTYPLPHPLPPPDYRHLDGILCRLVATAINEGRQEVELTDTLLLELEQWSPAADTPPPSSLEVYLHVQAASREELDHGNWRAVIGPNCGSPGGGRTFSRFFDLLGAEGLEKLRDLTQREESLTPGVIFAELSYLPTRGRAANVAIRPALRRYEIVVNTIPSVPADHVIPLSDLVVGVRNNRFYLRSLRLGEEVMVCQSHMLNPIMAPNVCRFLLEVSQDQHPGLLPFEWGIAAASPFLPRVVRGQIVLSPAQWNLSASNIELTGGGSEEARWLRGLRRWREIWRVPRYVYLTEMDHRLLLDLDHPLMALELRNDLARVGEDRAVRMQEMLPSFDQCWLRDSRDAPYLAEIVVPLVRNSTSISAQETSRAQRSYLPRLVTPQERCRLPGADWSYLKLYTAPAQHDGLIAGPLREIVQRLREQRLIDRWFFLRYSDPEPHLRLRFHAASAKMEAPVLLTTLAWARQLVERGMVGRICLDTYEREVERYGGPRAIDLFEQVFAANSTAISEIIAARYAGRITLDLPAVAVFSLDQYFAAWGLDAVRRLRRLKERTQKYQASKEFREQRKLLCDLLAPWEQTRDSVLAEQRALLRSLLSMHEEPLRSLAARVRSLADEGELWVPESTILDSLAHMHVNRLGLDTIQEARIYAFWRHTLESVSRRPGNYSGELPSSA